MKLTNKNKELKKEAIEYFVIEYYSNFDELKEFYNLEEIKSRLNKNIRKLISNKKSTVYLGRYYIINKKIKIYNKSMNLNNLELSDLKENIKLKNTMLHEFTHALFRKNIVTTGCFTINLGISMFKYYPRSVVKNRGLNEGLTNWVVQKCGIETTSYKFETNIVKMLEVYLGSKCLLNIIMDKSKNVHKYLNLSKKEFKKFSEMLDNINYIDIKLIRKINKNIKYTNIRNKINNKYIIIKLLNIEKKINKINESIQKLRNKRNKNEEILLKFVKEKYNS